MTAMTQNVFYGDWKKVKSYLQNAQLGSLSKAMKKPLEALGLAISTKIQQHIKDQDLPWEALSPETVAKKGHDLIYQETLAYFKGIRYRVYSKKKKQITMDVYLKGDHKPSGLPLELLGFYLEYGTSKIPERPIWRPTYLEMFRMKEFDNVKKQALDMGFRDLIG